MGRKGGKGERSESRQRRVGGETESGEGERGKSGYGGRRREGERLRRWGDGDSGSRGDGSRGEQWRRRGRGLGGERLNERRTLGIDWRGDGQLRRLLQLHGFQVIFVDVGRDAFGLGEHGRVLGGKVSGDVKLGVLKVEVTLEQTKRCLESTLSLGTKRDEGKQKETAHGWFGDRIGEAGRPRIANGILALSLSGHRQMI